MPCGCNKKKVGTQGELNRGVNGWLELFYHDPPEGTAYNGERRDEHVLVVGRLTPEERLFERDQLAEASAYAQFVGRAFITQPASLFPAEAIENLFAGLPHAEPGPTAEELDALSAQLDQQLSELEPVE